MSTIHIDDGPAKKKLFFYCERVLKARGGVALIVPSPCSDFDPSSSLQQRHDHHDDDRVPLKKCAFFELSYNTMHFHQYPRLQMNLRSGLHDFALSNIDLMLNW